VTVDAPTDLPVVADPDRLRQAVDNLLDNATRYALPGSDVQVTAAVSDDGTVALQVADRGPGFPEEFLPHAFERFHRAEAARSRDDGGTGLGLSIVQAIARAHGGEATAANRVDGGAMVTLHLPTAAGPQPLAHPEPPQPALAARAVSSHRSPSGGSGADDSPGAPAGG
jgi:signal transduction histidine kinase